jgi:tetratricopeptide (TPR) repeat protein
MRARFLLAALAGLLFAGAAVADVLVLREGGRIHVGTWWYDGDSIVYVTDAGTVSLPREQVTEIIEAPTDGNPKWRAKASLGAAEADGERAAPPAGDSDGAPAPSETSTRAEDESARTPPAPPELPSAEELDAAIESLRAQLRRAGRAETRARIERTLAGAWVLRARAHRSSGANERAVDAYEEALALVPQHLPALVELGWVELQDGASYRALARAETGLAESPDNPWLRELRGEVLYRNNRLADALDDLRVAAAARPDDEALVARIAKIEREMNAESGFRREDSSHFTLRFDGERDDATGALMLELLEESYADLSSELDAHVREPITVILYPRERFHDTTRSPREVAGLFDGKIRLPVGGLDTVGDTLRRVVRHEVVHALLHVKGRGRVPRWLHEGLAQTFEPRDPAIVRAALAFAQREKGETLDLEPFSYPTALSFVGFLEERYSRTRVLWMIELLAERRSENDAFREAFGASRSELVVEWRRWLNDRD